MRLENVFFTLAITIMILITVGYFIVDNPEDSSLTSDDGVVTVTGLTRQTQPFQVKVTRSVQTPLVGSAYLVKPDGITLDEPAVIAFEILEDQQKFIESLGVYKLHKDFNMWEPVGPVVAYTDEVLAIESLQLGEFALGSMSSFEAPVFANVYEELRRLAPAEAVGYEVAVGYTQADHEVIRLSSEGEQGGCGGVVRVGNGESFSRLERRATVEVDDISTTLTFIFVTRWFTSSGEGCVQTEPIRPLVEYDILNEIQT